MIGHRILHPARITSSLCFSTRADSGGTPTFDGAMTDCSSSAKRRSDAPPSKPSNSSHGKRGCRGACIRRVGTPMSQPSYSHLLLQLAHIPPLDRPILSAARSYLTVGGESHRGHLNAVRRQRSQSLASLCIPNPHFANAFSGIQVPTHSAADQSLSIRRERDCGYPTGMRLQCPRQLTCLRVPQPHCHVITGLLQLTGSALPSTRLMPRLVVGMVDSLAMTSCWHFNFHVPTPCGGIPVFAEESLGQGRTYAEQSKTYGGMGVWAK